MIVNVHRDALRVDLDQSVEQKTWSSDVANTTSTIVANCPTAVMVDWNRVQSDDNAAYSIAANNKKAIGCYIQQPQGDRTPYRVKAYAHAASGGIEFLVAVGYAPGTITGSDDTISEVVYLPFDHKFDDLIMVENEPEGDTYANRPLFFGIVAQSPSGGAGDYLRAALSVQNLGISAPTIQVSVP